MYLEDDILVSWQSLQLWAEDTAYLAPRGFQRGFQRTEVAPWDGGLMSPDQAGPVSIAVAPKLVVDTPTGQRQMPNPYMAMWIAEAVGEQLKLFMNSDKWKKKKGPWKTREMAACAMQFVNVTRGFTSQALVPYNPDLRQLDALAAIAHVSNNYCNPHSVKPSDGFCSVRWDELLTGR